MACLVHTHQSPVKQIFQQRLLHCEGGPSGDLHERLFKVVGFDAADIVRSGAVQGIHEHL